jgi:DNA-directed RNA polymerase subunit M/transcription elongation factor TFIIS
VDSIKASYGQVLLVDGGGFFPDDEMHKDVSWFLMDAMRVLGVDAVGMSERELRFGLAYLKAQQKRTQLPMVCANLYDKKTSKLVLAPYVLKQVGTVKVGIFGLMSDVVDLGPSKDSLRVEDPSAAAKRTVAALRKKGATVVVLLSELGKVEGEDLVTAVDGIDAVILGHSVPLLQKGRLIKATVACYGGEQGQYIGRTLLTLDAQRKVTTGECETFILGPDIPDKKEVAALVKGFNDSFNEKLQKLQKERAAKQAEQAAQGAPEHYLGSEICARCHPAETSQWQGTKHAHAWESLVAAKQDTVGRCIACHALGYNQPGGFKDLASTAKLVGVQCESCHGMGSTHEAFSATPRRVTEQTCRICHTKEMSPGFDYALYLPYVSHKGTGTKQPLPGSPMKKLLPASH